MGDGKVGTINVTSFFPEAWEWSKEEVGHWLEEMGWTRNVLSRFGGLKEKEEKENLKLEERGSDHWWNELPEDIDLDSLEMEEK